MQDEPPLSISLIGAGNLGKSLGKLWADNKLLSIKQVFTTRQQTADEAISFIGCGIAESNLAQLEHSDIILIATPDDQIDSICQSLLSLPGTLEKTLIFHCSGVLSSTDLTPLCENGASVASIHPIKSFADPSFAVRSFNGTFCGVEGDPKALSVLSPLFTQLGAHCLTISRDKKALYHCAAVFANNYMVSLVECAQELYELSGIDRGESMQVLAPMLRETCENLINFGTHDALTGPIARGDKQTILKHQNALKDLSGETPALYQALGRVALSLTTDSGDTLRSNEIRGLLSNKE